MSRLDVPRLAPNILPTLEVTHANVEATPNGDPRLAYNLAVPLAWAFSKDFGPATGGMFQSQGLGFFSNSTDPGAPVIAITVTALPFEVPIDAWIRQQFAAEGYAVVAAGWFPGPNGLFFELTGERVIKDVPEVRRTSVRADGNMIFSVNCLCARTNWDAAKEIFWVAHVTFELLGSPGQTRMELWVKGGADVPDFELAFPASWESESSPPSTDGVSACHLRLVDGKREKLLAYLQVKAVAGPEKTAADLEQLHEASLDSFRKAGVIAKGTDRPLTEDEDPRSIAVEGWLGGFTGKAQMRGTVVATRLGYLHRSDVTFSFALLSPLLSDDLHTALRAQRVFEIARATLSQPKQ
jgi:hypothetical protein